MTPVPSDPRTWAGFHSVAVRGFKKVDCETWLESVTTAAGFGLAILGAFCIWDGYVQALLSGQVDSSALAGGWRPAAVFVTGLGLMAVRLMTDSFYLIDPARDAVYLHFKIGPFRRVRRVGSIL